MSIVKFNLRGCYIFSPITKNCFSIKQAPQVKRSPAKATALPSKIMKSLLFIKVDQHLHLGQKNPSPALKKRLPSVELLCWVEITIPPWLVVEPCMPKGFTFISIRFLYFLFTINLYFLMNYCNEPVALNLIFSNQLSFNLKVMTIGF